MEQEITPEQKAQLETWAGKRDALLLEISTLQTAKDKLQNESKDLAISNTDIVARMNEVRGRIEELSAKEKESYLNLSKDVASMLCQKSSLEAEMTGLSKLTEVLSAQKKTLEKDITLVLSVFNTVRSETFLLEKIVDHVTKVSEGNIAKIDNLVISLGKGLEEIIEVNKKNVFETNVVIEKLPKMLVELQKHGLVKNKI
jgi:predicted  nucleic acid-binding Zn-ribbon protein